MLDPVSQERARPRWSRRLAAVGAAGVLVAGLVVAGAPGASAAPEPARATVDADVYTALADGPDEFFVYLAQTADLSAAATLDSKLAKGTHVFGQLTRTARTSQAPLRAMLDARGVEYTPFWIANVLLVTGDRALVDELAARPDVARIAPNRQVPLPEPVTTSPDGDNGIQAVEWGVANINADDVWNQFNVRGEGIVVANIDTGVQHNHPALVNQYRGTATGSHDYNWFDPAGVCVVGVPCDNNGHGTHTMGTMVGDDGGSNQVGVAPRAQWIAAKGCESNFCTEGSLLASGQWVLAPTRIDGSDADPAMAPDTVNNSWGGGRGDTWYQATINSWINAGIFPMFSAGNSGPACNTANSPGDNIPAYAVGAYDINNTIASFSSRGPSGVSSSEIKPNVSAPGVAVRSSVPINSYANFSGTSMASPHAAGVVALVWSAAPDLVGDIAGTRAVLDQTARNVGATGCGGSTEDNNIFGEGRIDALAAVTLATGGGPPDPGVVADFTFECSRSGGARTCSFDGSPSTGDIVTFSWNFDDGSTGSGAVVTHTYQGGRSRDVTLTVADGDGGTDSITRSVTP
ncbi:MAG: S8 family serine peptidase [Micromonosporaceae bacterium]|nr:S8 family serine peptidase [Micromonosporaceae bacterium]